MSATAEATRELAPPAAWNERMLLVYPHGMRALFEPIGRYFRPGDLINGYVLDHFEVSDDGESVLCVLARASRP
jgi:hypothetical protein